MMSAAQLRMARAALRMRSLDLAQAAQVGITTINRFETEQSAPIPATIAAIQRALEAAGVEFMDGGWVRLRQQAGGREAPVPISKS